MNDETRTPHEIEREIEAQRAELTSNLEGLQDKFSLDSLVRQVADQFREHGGDMGRSITAQVKANPIPLALTGIGLAWLMFGNSRMTAPASGFSSAEDQYRQTRLDQNRPYTPPVATYPAQRASPSWARDDRDGTSSMSDRAPDNAGRRDEGSNWRTSNAQHRDASSAASSISDGASTTAATVGDAVSSAASKLAGGVQSLKGGLNAAGSRIAEGTEDFSEEGRKRVIAARQKALEMRRSATQGITHGTDAAADFYDRQPLVFGALALAFGAAFGGVLPRTQAEDALMGDQSDMVFDEAERIYEEEKAKVMKVAETVKGEVEEAVEQAKSNPKPGQKSDAQDAGEKSQPPTDRGTEPTDLHSQSADRPDRATT